MSTLNMAGNITEEVAENFEESENQNTVSSVLNRDLIVSSILDAEAAAIESQQYCCLNNTFTVTVLDHMPRQMGVHVLGSIHR